MSIFARQKDFIFFGGLTLRGNKGLNDTLPRVAIILLIGLISHTAGLAQTQESSFSTVVKPDQYVVGPGDRFRIDFWSGATPPIEVSVTPEGFVLMSSIGRVDVGNLTLSEARLKLKGVIRHFTSDTAYTVTLIGVRPVKVLISEGVQKPGLYEGFVSQRVSEMIEKAGGLIDGASRRNIKLMGGRKVYNVDILRYQRVGDLEADPYLYCGHKIAIPLITDSSSFVQLSGEVVSPGGFEFREGDNLGTMIDLGLGLTGLQGDSVLIFRNSHILTTIPSDTGMVIQPGDKIIVVRKHDIPEREYYSISGEVLVPGRYPYGNQPDFGAALKMAGWLTPKGDIYSAVIFRKAQFRKESGTARLLKGIDLNNLAFNAIGQPVSLDIGQFYPDRLDKIKILPGDSIFIPALTGAAGVFGMVRQPGMIDFSGSTMKLGSLVKKAGGYAEGAEKRAADVIRKSSGMKIRASGGTEIYDGDIIVIPENRQKKSTWDRLKDISLILGGLGAAYLAIDNLAN
jgi:protein involved in polysaccharide export with SLBB domain